MRFNKLVSCLMLFAATCFAQQGTGSGGTTPSSQDIPHASGAGPVLFPPLSASSVPVSTDQVITLPQSALVASIPTSGLYNLASCFTWNGQPVTVDNMPSEQNRRLKATINFYVLPDTPNILYVQITDVVTTEGAFWFGAAFDNVTLTGIRFVLFRKRAFPFNPAFSNNFANPGEVLADGTSGTEVDTPLSTTPNYAFDAVKDPLLVVSTTTGANYGMTSLGGIHSAIRIRGGGVFQLSFDPNIDLSQQVDFSKTFAEAIYGNENQYIGARRATNHHH